MDWEYRALVWDTYYPRDGPDYEPARTHLIADGWREFVRAPRQPGIQGGACIMRRPKDEPHSGPAQWERLYREHYGVDPPTCFYLLPPRLCPIACKEPKDEPRKWTEGEIAAFFAGWKERSTVGQSVLQAAIDEVVSVSKEHRRDCRVAYHVVRRLLFPLATKEGER